jgi:hypothetical protein
MGFPTGRRFVSGRIPGERISKTVASSDGGTFTTSLTSLIEVTGTLVALRTYRVRANVTLSTSVAGDVAALRIHEGSGTGGTSLGRWLLHLPTTSTVTGYPAIVEVDFTALSTGSQTFTVSGQRITGTGNLQLEAASDRLSTFEIFYVEG